MRHSDQEAVAAADFEFSVDDAGQLSALVRGERLHIDGACHSYAVDDTRMTTEFGTVLPAVLADFVDLALAVYVADRLALRRPPHAERYPLHWTRQLRLRLPMRQPEFWRDKTLTQAIATVLWQFTEDDWQLEFVPREGGYRRSETQAALFPLGPEPPVAAALFSGGLDSFAGLCRDIESALARSFVLIAFGTNIRMHDVRDKLVKELRTLYSQRLQYIEVPFRLSRNGRSYHDDERTQRSRGFVYLAIGAVTAVMAGSQSLAMYENGVGCINLPYTAAQLGAQNSRAARPDAVAAMADLLSMVMPTNAPKLRLPCLFSTKGELCAGLRRPEIIGLIHLTMSCDGFPLRQPGKPQCGVCTSCVLRQQALYGAGLHSADAIDSYSVDLLGAELPAAEKLYPLRAMVDQVATLKRALASPDPWRALVHQYPELATVAACCQSTQQDPVAAKGSLVRLYQRYCDEWSQFPIRLYEPLVSSAT
jgi:7-cyano-7-deazaguanine synthase in queuosine biosynthesis